MQFIYSEVYLIKEYIKVSDDPLENYKENYKYRYNLPVEMNCTSVMSSPERM